MYLIIYLHILCTFVCTVAKLANNLKQSLIVRNAGFVFKALSLFIYGFCYLMKK